LICKGQSSSHESIFYNYSANFITTEFRATVSLIASIYSKTRLLLWTCFH